MKGKVTFGVCVRNCEGTIRESMESILNQAFPHELMEIIVVDGESKDGTTSVIEEVFSKSDLQARILSDRGEGLGAARQAVVDNASGEYILWVDGDMTLAMNHARTQVTYMDQHPNVGAAKGKRGRYGGNSLVAFLESMRIARSQLDDSGTSSKLLGISGTIFRVNAVREVGGFDKRIRGAGEDIEIEVRMRAAGWSYHKTKAQFYHKERETWAELFHQYFWYGFGAHFLFHKHKDGVDPPWTRFPPFSFLTGLLLSFDAYRFTRRKVVFLLPFEHVVKKVAWCLGFVKGHLNGYQP